MKAVTMNPERLYARNLGLVGLCLKRFPFLTGEAREDAYGAGMLGLWTAAQRFDPARSFAFGTYAVPVIRGFILRRLKEDRQQTRLSCVSLETPLMGKEGDGGELADLVADPNAEKPGERAMDTAGFEALLAPLTERQQHILRSVYQEDMTFAEIGDALGITQQRCHQIQVQAIARLRKARRQQQKEMLKYALVPLRDCLASRDCLATMTLNVMTVFDGV